MPRTHRRGVLPGPDSLTRTPPARPWRDRYRAVVADGREQWRRALRVVYGQLFRRLNRLPDGPSGSPRVSPTGDSLFVPRDQIPTLGYDEFTVSWASRLLLNRDPAPPFPPADRIESAADAARLRGVVPYLCRLRPHIGEAVLEDRLRLLRNWLHGSSGPGRPAVWDTTNVALRILAWLEGVGHLRRRGHDALADRILPSQYLRSHAGPLMAGLWVEPGGNHRAVNAVGVAGLEILLSEEGSSTMASAHRLATTLQQQFFSDGGHRERCPQYHLQVLAILQTLEEHDYRRHPAVEALRAPTRRALSQLTFQGLPAPLGDLSRLWSGRTVTAEMERVQKHVSSPSLGWLPDSGVASWRWRTRTGEPAELVADLGPMGTEYPGHAHDDTLTYCLRLGDVVLVADPGTFRYHGAPDCVWHKRDVAHNTVSHDGDERAPRGFYRWPTPICREVVEVQRVAARTATATRWGHEQAAIAAHRRRWSVAPSGVKIVDQVRSGRLGGGTVRVNLGPSCRIRPSRSGGWDVHAQGLPIARIRARSSHPMEASAVRARFAPGYGELMETESLEFRFGQRARDWVLELSILFAGQ